MTHKLYYSLYLIIKTTKRGKYEKKDIEIFESMNENDKIFEVTEENYKVTEELDEFEKIKKLKGLLDIGAISQEEFDKKKKELLGL